MKCRWLVAAACASVSFGAWLEAAENSAANVIERYELQEADTPVKDREGWRKPKRVLVDGFASRLGQELKSAAPEVEFIVAGTPEAKAKIASIDVTRGY